MTGKKIMAIFGSPNKDSLSTKANVFVVNELSKKYPNSQISLLDLNDSIFTKTLMNANNMPNYFNEIESDLWINKLKEIDILVISSPMINFNYSILIKNFIDSICVANKTFSYKYSKKGASVGLLDNLNVIIIGTQGAPLGWYPFGNHIEQLKGTFNFLGAQKIETLLIDGTKVEPRSKLTQDEIINEVSEQLKCLIKTF
ncbi:FMN-dependent NADH-azoreductase [Mycoplasmopsis felifaucium]|uniref:FMN-dependent NADH-azoreductase n=1 Tax=Mycoplasmopsis felifaucium TaxID=35768 RepID=UPI0004833DFC|nr:FMN-dependent NADH-azoreductase [Mycoplasmopsis felifaucium]